MGRTAIFNGVELVIPDAYSALDVTRLLTPTSGGVGIVALVGEADGGKPGVNIFPGGTSTAVIKRELRSGPLADGARLALRAGTDNLVQAGASTLVAYKTNNSTQSTLPIGGTSAAVAQEEEWDFAGLTGNSFDVVGAALSLNLASALGYLWFNVTDGANVQADPLGVGVSVQVDILDADTPTQIVNKAFAALNLAAIVGVDIAAEGAAGVLEVLYDAGAQASNGDAGDSGTAFSVIVPGVAADTDAQITLFTAQYGVFTELYTGEIATVGGAKFITVRDDSGTPQTSPGLGVTSYLNIQYTGDASTALLVLEYVASLLRLQITLAGDQTDGSQNIDLDVTGLTVGNIAQIVSGLTGYSASVDPARQQFKATDLDLVLNAGALDVKTAALDLPASIKEAQDWAANQSTFLEKIVRGVENEGDTILSAFPTTQFSGGTRGTTSNSSHQAGLNVLLGLRINILTSLFSSDLQDGSTVTISAINAQVKDHVQFRSSILGRSECQAYTSIKGDKDAFKAECASLNSRWVACTSQIINDLDIDGNIKDFPEWGFAVVCAQTQAGSPIGTDLTYRALPVRGISQHPSWNPVENGPELIKAGALIGGADENNVNRVIAGYTTWLADDNNANIFIETVESLAIFAFNHRRFMKQRFLGQSAFTRQSIVDAITQSVEVETDTTKSIKGFDLEQVAIISASAGRLEYEVPVVPFEGIKFVLPTVVAIREVA